MLLSSLSGLDWFILILCSLLIGANKAGLRGVSIVVIPIFASYFGGKTSSSIVLPLLICGDICAVVIYKKSVALEYLKKMLPFAVLGIALGMVLGQYIPDDLFRFIMACFILLCLVLMVIKEFSTMNLSLPDHYLSHCIGGLLGGFTTMIGNAAGPIMSLYLLSLNLPKKIFIGTGAIFFLIVNLIKVPVHLFAWQTMSWATLQIDLILAPFIFLGLFIGMKIVHVIPDKPFRVLIILATLAGVIKLFLS